MPRVALNNSGNNGDYLVYAIVSCDIRPNVLARVI